MNREFNIENDQSIYFTSNSQKKIGKITYTKTNTTDAS